MTPASPVAGIGSRYVVVTPVRDEASHIARTIESMRRQTLRPLRWVIVDDGSTDGTGRIVDDETASMRDWVAVVHRTDRGHRASGGGVVEAFYAGFALLPSDGWDCLVKLDGDLSFDADYFAACLQRFEADPALGIGGGSVCALEDGRWRVEAAGDPAFHVRGATKIYRRACWQAIAPLIQAPGWDTLDEVRANRLGWRTRSFPELPLWQHKPTGSADGAWKDSFKNGKANYITGYHPVFMAAKCVKRLAGKPFLLGAVGLGAGFVAGYLKRLPRLADDDAIRYLRQQQLRRLLLRPSIYG